MELKKVGDKLYRGPRPGSYAELAAAGVTAVVNLESGVYEATHNDTYEHEKPEDFGLKAFDIRCSDITPPSRASVARFIAIVEQEKCVYVHCLHGRDRTGFMCAAYRMVKQYWSLAAATTELYSLGFHKIPYFGGCISLKSTSINNPIERRGSLT